MFNSVSKALIPAPHTDDGELGVGGTIAKLVEQNIDVVYAAFSTAAASACRNATRYFENGSKECYKIAGH